MTRREFTSTLAVSAAPLPLRGQASPVEDAVRPAARPFPLRQVRLLEGTCSLLAERDRAFLHSLEPERLLHTFRLNAGIASSAAPLGGWEAPAVELRGHFTGHYLSACALMAVSARDGLLKSKADALVAELARCQKALGGGYLSAFPLEFMDRLRDGKKVWAPWYTIHKIMAGMLDMYTLTGNQQALDAAAGMAGWCRRWTGQLDDARMARVLEVEHGGMNEVLANLYAATGNRDWLDTAHRFDHRRIFDPLAAGRDELKGLHVNTQIPKIIGAARLYELTGDRRYHDIAAFFWRQVVDHRAYATGGTSNDEHWRTDPDRLASELSATTQECCCTYNMLKLTRHVFGWTADARAADYHERALFNGILGTLNPKDGQTMYYVPLASGYWKMFSLPRNSFWCCTGTGLESFAKLADSIYFHDDRGLWVNLFVPSLLEWPGKGLRLRQENNFPDQESASFSVDVDQPVEFELRIRAPYWAGSGAGIRINGQAQAGTSPSGGYRTVARTWKKGDRVEVSLPMRLHAHPMPDDASLQAILYGPVVLAGRLGAEGLRPEQFSGEDPQEGYHLRGDPAAVPDIRAASGDPASWIEPVSGQPLTFRMKGQARNLALIPLNRLFGERYAVYWRVRGA